MKNRRKLIQFVLGLLLSGIFLYLIAVSIPVDDILSALAAVKFSWVCAGVASFGVGYMSRIRRWQLMLMNENATISFYQAGIPFMVSIAANNILPFRLGDVMRAFAFSKWLAIPSSRVLATLVAERLLDILALLAALGFASLVLGFDEGHIANLLGVGSIGLMAAAAVILIAFVYPQIVQPLAMFVIRSIAPWLGELGARLVSVMERLFDSLRMMTRSGRTTALIFWSFLAWVGEAGVFLSAAFAVPAMTAPYAAFLAMPIGTLATLLPSSPGYIGTFHYFVIEAAELLGNQPAAATAFAVVAHLILWTSATVTGGVCFVIWSVLGGRSE